MMTIPLVAKITLSAFDFDKIAEQWGEGRAGWLIRYIPLSKIVNTNDTRILTFYEHEDLLINWRDPEEWLLEQWGPTELEILEILCWTYEFAYIKIKQNKG